MSSENFISSFKAKRRPGGKVNPNASHLNIGMLQLSDHILQVGDFKLVTTARAPLLPSPSKLNEDAVWWWTSKKGVFAAVVPPNPFGKTNEQLWLIVSQVFPHT